MASKKRKYYGFDIETNEKTGELYLWCLSYCDDFKKLIENPTDADGVKREKFGVFWDDFFSWLDNIEKGSIILIHNMSFDFNAILANCPDFATRYDIDNDKSIITGYHSFIRIVCRDFTILDSAQITRMSIYGIGELLGIPKLEEQYDGRVTSNSINYCYRDTELSIRGVAYFCKAYGTKSLPLTSTGYNKKVINRQIDKCTLDVAKKENNKLQKAEQNYNKFYELVRKSYSGGVCYANMFYAGHIQQGIQSADIGSSYPTAMIGYLLPSVDIDKMRPISHKLGDYIIDTFRKTSYNDAFSAYNLCSVLGKFYDNKGFLCKIKITGKMRLHIFDNKNYFPLISMTKKRKTKTHNITGLYLNRFSKFKTCYNKLLYMEEGDTMEMACSEYDLYMLLHCYDIDTISIEYGYIYDMKISQFLIKCVNQFLNDKNLCKKKDGTAKWNNDIFKQLMQISIDTHDEKLYDFVYHRTKECVNGMYGINVEDKEKPKFVFYDNEIKESNDTSQSASNSPYNELVGAYISGFGRWQLFIAFIGIIKNGGVNYYSDTDSVKIGGCSAESVMAYYNKMLSMHWDKMEKTIKGYKHPTLYGIGELDAEDINGCMYFDFCTIGSKNYLCYANNKIKATISGVRNCSDIFNYLYKKEKSFDAVVKKYYHYGLIIQNNKLVPDYTHLGDHLENGNRCVVLRSADFSLLNNDGTGEINRMVAETFFNNTSKCFIRKETKINADKIL